MLTGEYNGKKMDLVTGMFEGVGKVKAGTLTLKELNEMEDVACPSCGSCAGMFTANSMNCMTEALGMGLRDVEQFLLCMLKEFVLQNTQE